MKRLLATLLLSVALFFAVSNIEVFKTESTSGPVWVVRWMDAENHQRVMKFHGTTAEHDARAFAAQLASQ